MPAGKLNDSYFADLYFNKNEGDETKWTYDPDFGPTGGRRFQIQPDINGRLTWQVDAKNKAELLPYSSAAGLSTATACRSRPSRPTSSFWIPAAQRRRAGPRQRRVRLLLEARLASHGEVLHNAAWRDDPNSVWRRLIAVSEQGGRIPNLLYRGAGQAAGPTFIFAAMSAPQYLGIEDVRHLRHGRSRASRSDSSTRGAVRSSWNGTSIRRRATGSTTAFRTRSRCARPR